MTVVDHRQYSWEDLENEQEWRRCFPATEDVGELADAFKHFCANYWVIQRPDGGRLPFTLYDAQYESVIAWLEDRYSITLKSRQIGWTTLLAAFAFWSAFGYQDRPILVLSRNQRYANKLLAKAKYGHKAMPKWMRERGPLMNWTQSKVDFTNGSYVESLPSASDPARGDSAWLVAVDEFAFFPNQEEAWASLEAVPDAGGRLIMLSTAQGEGDVFHTLWVGAEQGRNRFNSIFHPWWVNGRDQAWYDRQVEELATWQRQSEYPENPEEAFLKSGRPVFDPETLKRRQAEVRDPIMRGRFVDGINGAKVFDETDEGEIEIWELPTQQGRYSIGGDASQGLEHGDFSSAHVVSADTGNVVAHFHGKIDADLFGTQVIGPLGRWYNQALVLVESNSHGLTTLKALERTGYFPIYTERNSRYKDKGKRATPTEQLGIRTTQISKPLMIDGLHAALRDDEINLWSLETFNELRSYVYVGTSQNKMEGTPHDDRTMSLAIANHGRRFVFLKKYKTNDRIEPGSFEDWSAKLYGTTLTDLKERRKARPYTQRGGDLLDREPIGWRNVRSPLG